MKNIYFLLGFMLLSSFGAAQTITFTDANFKTSLLSITVANERAKDLSGNWCTVDTNSDGEIQLSEAENLSYLDFSISYIHDLSEISFFTSLTELYCGSNVLTTLDVSSCTALTLLECDNNYLTTLDISGCTALTVLDCAANNLTNLDVSSCTALTVLHCEFNELTSLDVSSCTALTQLYCENNYNNINSITTLDVSNCTALTVLHCSFNDLTTLDVSDCTALTELHCVLNNLTTLDVSSCTALTELHCEDNNLTSLDVSACTALTQLYCYNNDLTTLDVSSCTALNSLDCDSNSLTSLNVTGCTALNELHCQGNNLTTLDVSDCTALTHLNCGINALTTLDVSSCTDLTQLYCQVNNLTTLDVSSCTALTYLVCNSNDLSYLNISNTVLDQNDISNSLIGSNNYSEVCCDVELYAYMFNYLQSSGYNNCILNAGEDCSPVNQSIISVTFDADANGCGTNDEVLESFKVNVHSSIQDTDFEFNENSNYTVYTIENVATITLIINNSYFTITPPSYSVDYTQGNFETLEFCLAPNGNHNDLEIAIIPVDMARPGFETEYKLIYKNNGTTTLSGNVQLTFEDDYMDLVSATPSVDTQSSNSLTWNYSNLAPFEEREILFKMELNTPTDTSFPLNSGDILSFQAQINPITGDEMPVDNTFLLQQEVVNSQDPNDKILLEGSQILPEMVGEYVHYRIRFENTGTANAINVFVEDTIDPTQFDISTLEVVDASHSVRTVIEDDLVKFQFYNINLPFDDANNDGYVVFKIKTLDTLELNDTFSNQAEIYFDYNAPIVTNNFTTTIVENLGTEDVESPSDLFTLSPNPAKDFFTIQTSEAIQKVELFDTSGRLVKTYLGNTTSYDVSSIAKGVYVVKVYTENGAQTLSIMKK